MSQFSNRYHGVLCFSAVLVWICGLLFCLVPCYGQIVTASLGGMVTDPAGSVVPRGRRYRNQYTNGIVTKATSDSAGFYLFSSLSPANYTITWKSRDFSATVISGITLEVNQQARVDAKLKVGAVTTTVQVSGAAPMVQRIPPASAQSLPAERWLIFPSTFVGFQPWRFWLRVLFLTMVDFLPGISGRRSVR